MRGVVIAGLVLLGLGGIGAAVWSASRQVPPTEWRTVEVSRTRVRSVVSSTGNLEAVTSVEIGAQVTGILSEVLVDFNHPVKAGQVLAKIDRALLSADVESAEAQAALVGAERDLAEATLLRQEALFARQASSEQEIQAARAAKAVADARLRSARVALERARRNLGYTTITSPIDGTVVSRAVEPGQTVNAGLSAPILFVIAGDLARMQILAAVDESDVGQIRPGQHVEFTVQAWPDQKFKGTVREIRLQSSLSENVVTYPTVVDVDNADLRLLPGMTATVEFIVAEAEDVLCAPNAALRFSPAPEQITPAAAAELARRKAERQAGAGREGGQGVGSAGSAAPGGGAASAAQAGGGAAGQGAQAVGGGGASTGRGGRSGRGGPPRVWTVAPDGLLQPVRVKAGLKDSECTEVEGEGIAEGTMLVTGVVRQAEGAPSTSVFQPQGAGGMRRPGGF